MEPSEEAVLPLLETGPTSSQNSNQLPVCRMLRRRSRGEGSAELTGTCYLQDAGGATSGSRITNKLLVACGLTFAFMLVELIGGYIANSVAVMSDAAHMFSDTSSFAISALATMLMNRRSCNKYSFGYHRAETVGALFSVLIIAVVTGGLVLEAVQRIINPVPVDGKIMFIVSVIGIVFNIILAATLGVEHHHGCGHSHSHSHGHDHGCGHSHSHSHGHDHAKPAALAAAADADSHSHGHSHAHAHGGCTHAHGHAASSSNGHEHSHDAAEHVHKDPKPLQPGASGCSHSHSHSHSHHGSSPEAHGHDHSAPKCSHSHGAAHTHSHDSSKCAHNHGHAHDEDSHAAETHKADAASEGTIIVAIDHPDEHDHSHDHSHDHGHCHGGSKGKSCAAGACVPAASQAAHAHDDHHGCSHGHGHSHGHRGHSHDHENLNMRGAVVHVLGDLLQSIGVAIAGAVIWYTNGDKRFLIVDPLCTFMFAALVVWVTKDLVSDIIHVLMEGTPEAVSVDGILTRLQTVEGVLNVHDLHIWSLATGKVMLTAHIDVLSGVDPGPVLHAAEQIFESAGVHHSTVQICSC